jgi:hypothetical protein
MIIAKELINLVWLQSLVILYSDAKDVQFFSH